jgi:hypothetical protein
MERDNVSELLSPTGLLFTPPEGIWIWATTVEWYWQGKPKNSENTLSQRHFIHHKSHMDLNGRESVPCGVKPTTNRLNHGGLV